MSLCWELPHVNSDNDMVSSFISTGCGEFGAESAGVSGIL